MLLYEQTPGNTPYVHAREERHDAGLLIDDIYLSTVDDGEGQGAHNAIVQYGHQEKTQKRPKYSFKPSLSL